MNTTIKHVVLALVMSVLTATCFAQTPDAGMQPVTKELADSISKAIEASVGSGGKVQSVFKSPYFGLYEVRIGNNLLYTDAKVTYVFSGNVFDGKTLDNLTEERLNRLTAIKFSELPLDLALKTVKGKGTRKVAVFEDPNCGYCKLFRKTLTELDDATIYTFVLPILGPDSITKSKALLCANDKNKAWDEWMLQNKMADGSGECGAPIAKLQELGKKLNISGTPAVFFSDGSRAAGAIPASQLEQRLALAAKIAK